MFDVRAPLASSLFAAATRLATPTERAPGAAAPARTTTTSRKTTV